MKIEFTGGTEIIFFKSSRCITLGQPQPLCVHFNFLISLCSSKALSHFSPPQTQFSLLGQLRHHFWPGSYLLRLRLTTWNTFYGNPIIQSPSAPSAHRAPTGPQSTASPTSRASFSTKHRRQCLQPMKMFLPEMMIKSAEERI